MKKYTLKEVEKKFDIPLRKTLFLIKKGVINAVVEGSRIFVSDEEIEKYLKLDKKTKGKHHKSYLASLGPGLITGAADDDPSGTIAYTQVGAQFGLGLSWMALYLTPMMIAVQETSARIGIVTGKGLSGVIKKYYSKRLLVFLITLLVIANTVNIGADIGAMAAALELVTPINYFAGAILVTAAMIALQLKFSYQRYAQILKFLTLSLFAYVITGFIVRPDFTEVLRSLVIPKISFSPGYLAALVAVAGTTISPYLFFWQASEEVEECRDKKISAKAHPIIIGREIKEMRKDTTFGMIVANIVFLFIIITAAAVLHTSGVTTIETAQDAALALRPLAGEAAYYLFTIGILGVGLLAVPVLAGSSAYAISELAGFKEGFSRKYIEARGFYIIIIISMLVGFLLNFVGINPMRALYYTAILNGLISPIIMYFIFRIGRNEKIMGKFVSPKWVNLWGGIATILMGGAAIFLVLSFI
ncbi:MAG: divalent metal cation transporter [Patescibacteria group bacterium]|nr:divalent metal cation transporter [Patescibacteria group bacterium]